MSSAPPASPLTLGTAGHIDHGKTTLVRALTGVDTDRLPQERERGISIELGFAPLELPSGRRVSVVDVPGHERFVRTMVAGATGIDLFLLVVAADDAVMPQTREHLAVLELLDVAAGVVAITKSDAVDAEQLELARADVAGLLADGPFATVPVVAASAVSGSGLDVLRAELDRAADRVPGADSRDGPARLHVDRSFSLQGVGTVVTGTLWSGSLGRGDEVRIEPRGSRARVRGVEVHGERRERAGAGQRVAANLAGIERREVERGDVVVAGAEEALAPAYVLDAAVRLVGSTRPLGPGTRVHVHHGTREAPARVALLEGDRLAPGREGFVQLRLERPLIAAAGDRFVIRSIAPVDTIGGGRVLDPRARKHGPGEAHTRRLRALAAGDPLALLRLEIEAAHSGLDPAGVAGAVETLAADGTAILVGRRARRWFSPSLLARARTCLLGALSQTADPRPRTPAALAHAAGLEPGGAAAVLERLADEGAVEARAGGYALAADAHVADEPPAPALLDLLRADGLEPRGAAALADAAEVPPRTVADVLERLAAAGALTRVGRALYFHPEALAQAQAEVVGLCERDGAVTIAGLRDRLGTSRKYAQALLEHFDSDGVTRRVGDEHVLRRRAGRGGID
jgi:selenocysteine-specific elongation factor